MNDIKQVSFFMEECKRMGLAVLGPDVNESYYKFTVNEDYAVRFGMGAIKGVGAGAVQTIVDNRKEAKKIVVTQQDNDNINIIIANSAYELNMYPLARDYYTKLNLHTPSKDNLFRVITMSGKLNKADDVEMRMNDYKRLYPGDKEYRKKIYIAAGESLYNNKKADLAEKYYKEYLATDKDPDILNALTALLVNEKKYSELGQALDKQSDTTENRYLRAVSAAGLGNYQEAENYYQSVLKDIDNEYLMIKFLIEIKKCEDLKKEYGSLVEKEKTLNKETLKL